MAKKKTRTKVEESQEAEADLTPMIDVTFLLLIFFILNLKFKVEEGEIQSYLPKDKGQGSGTPQIDLTEVRIKLLWYDHSGRPTKDKDNGTVILKIGRNTFNGPGELDNAMEDNPLWVKLHDELVGYATKNAGKGKDGKGQPVIIDARPQVPYRYVVRALNEVVRAGITDVTFAAPEKPY